MKINTVAILGAGAVGSYFIWGLSEKLGDNLYVIADGERREKISDKGLIINKQRFFPKVISPKEAFGVDLLLVSVKYTSLYSSLDDIKAITGSHTTVMSLLNGVTSEEIIGEKIGMEHMLYSMIKISSERRNGETVFDPAPTLGVYFGEKDSPLISERMKAVIDLFKDTPIHYHICEDIMHEIWDKFALNISNNLPQAILGCGLGAYADSVYAAHIFQKLRDEVVEVAAAKGITLSREPDDALKRGIVTKKARYSTLQDLDARRHTEIDMLAGAMVRMGKELGIPTPYNEFAYNAIKALEEKNDGKFDY